MSFRCHFCYSTGHLRHSFPNLLCGVGFLDSCTDVLEHSCSSTDSLKTLVLLDGESNDPAQLPQQTLDKLDTCINYVYVDFSQGDYKLIDDIARSVLEGEFPPFPPGLGLSMVKEGEMLTAPLLVGESLVVDLRVARGLSRGESISMGLLDSSGFGD